MKKSALFIFALVLFSLAARAQGPISSGQMQINLGTGYVGGYLPFYVGMDFGVHPDISIGPKVILSYYRHSHFDYFNWGEIYYMERILDLGAAFVFDYHFNRLLGIPENFDLYAGADAGIYGYSLKEVTEYYDFDFITTDILYETGSYGNFSVHAGGRYIFPSGLGLNLQFDLDRFGIGGAYFGITKKF